MAIVETLSRGRREWSLRRIRRTVEMGSPNAPGRSAWVEHRRRAFTNAMVAPAARRRWVRTIGTSSVAVIVGVAVGALLSPLAGVLAATLLALTGSAVAFAVYRAEPGTVAWWRDRAIGCWETAAALKPLEALGWTVLHDRAVPGTATVADHLLIGPSGIWVVTSERTRGSLRSVNGRWWYTGRLGHLVEEVGTARAALLGRNVVDTLSDAARHAGLDGVHQVLAVWGADVPNEGIVADDVFVIAGERLATMIASSPATASSAALQPVIGAARERLPEILVDHLPAGASPEPRP